MAALNKVFLIGNLTRDPELRYTPAGTAVTDFGLAVNRQWRAQDGERKEEVLFVDITAWARSAEVISQYCHKGDPIFVEGRLQLDTWEGQDGQKRNRMRVVAESFQFLRGRGGQGAPPGEERPPGQRPNARPPRPANDQADGPPAEAPPDDDIPF